MLAQSERKLDKIGKILQIRKDSEADDGPNIYREERQVSHDSATLRGARYLGAVTSLPGRAGTKRKIFHFLPQASAFSTVTPRSE